MVANTSTQEGRSVEVIVDASLNPVGAAYEVLFTNRAAGNGGGAAPGPVLKKAAGTVEIREVNGSLTRGPARAVRVNLQKMELQILRKRGES